MLRKLIFPLFFVMFSCSDSAEILENENANSNTFATRLTTNQNTVYIVDEQHFIAYFTDSIASGDNIILPSDLVVNLPEQSHPLPFEIPENVTIDGGGSISECFGTTAKITVTVQTGVSGDGSLFHVTGDNVTFQNVILVGPYPSTIAETETGSDAYWIGIEVDNSDNFAIQESHLWGWSDTAVKLRSSKNATVSYNCIRNNRAENKAYGVQVRDGSYAVITDNYFQLNRHHIAGTGNSDGNGFYDGYEATNNVFNMSGMWLQGIDMHGGNSNDTGGQAGGSIWVHNNSFTGYYSGPAIKIRHIPKDSCLIENNSFSDYDNEERAVRQRNAEGFFGNFESRNNTFEEANQGIYISWGGTSAWYRIKTLDINEIHNLGLGKFTDHYGFMNFTGSEWHRYNFENQYGTIRPPNVQIDVVNWYDETINDVDFGDFNGDGETDIFKTESGKWYASYSGSGSWTQIASSNYTLGQIGFGDFNGDGKTDVFRANGNDWKVKYTGTGMPWTQISTLPERLNEIAFGDFNGDGTTDVFKTESGKWYVAYSGLAPWVEVASSNYTLDKLAYGDFDGDGKTDVFRATNGLEWYVKFTGTSGWTLLSSKPQKLKDLAFGDFNQDGITDVIAYLAPFSIKHKKYVAVFGTLLAGETCSNFGIQIKQLH